VGKHVQIFTQVAVNLIKLVANDILD